jgi:hypothetical protein
VKNLYLLVLLIKNDPIVRFEAKGGPSKDVDAFGETEEKILDMQDAEFCDEVENCVKECAKLRHVSMIYDGVLFIPHMEHSSF